MDQCFTMVKQCFTMVKHRFTTIQHCSTKITLISSEKLCFSGKTLFHGVKLCFTVVKHCFTMVKHSFTMVKHCFTKFTHLACHSHSFFENHMFIFNYEYANYNLLLNMGAAANINSDVFLYPLTNLSLLPFNLIFFILINMLYYLPPLRHTYVVVSMGLKLNRT